jgi:hypothetical protein
VILFFYQIGICTLKKEDDMSDSLKRFGVLVIVMAFLYYFVLVSIGKKMDSRQTAIKHGSSSIITNVETDTPTCSPIRMDNVKGGMPPPTD